MWKGDAEPRASSVAIQLEHEWTVYYDEGPPKDSANFDSVLHPVGTFDSIQVRRPTNRVLTCAGVLEELEQSHGHRRHARALQRQVVQVLHQTALGGRRKRARRPPRAGRFFALADPRRRSISRRRTRRTCGRSSCSLSLASSWMVATLLFGERGGGSDGCRTASSSRRVRA